MKSCSDILSKRNLTLTPFLIFLFSLFLKLALYNFIALSYDEVAYSITAKTIAENGGWLNLYNSTDLFFFPPLFNWLSAFFIMTGFEQIVAVRTVTIILSSGIPVLIYLLMIQSGISRIKSVFASLIWIIMPGSIYYSVAGQVETPFLFFILMSAYFIHPAKRNFKNIIFSAIFFAMAVWIKETAIGFIAVFCLIFLLEKEIRKGFLWISVSTVFCLPLFIQSFIPKEYDLFFELSNDLINWGAVSFLKPFENTAVLAGFNSTGKWTMILISLSVFAAIAISSVVALYKNRDSFIVRFSIISNLVFIPFFIFFPKKFDYYLLPVLLFSLIVIAISMAEKKYLMIAISAVFIFYSVEGLKWRSFIRNYYDETVHFLTMVAHEDPGAQIGTPTPHMAIYVKEKLGLNVKIFPLDFFSGYDPEKCRTKDDRCILRSDYFLTNDEFFAVLFCLKWPVKRDACDIELMRKVVENIDKKGKGTIFDLYKVKKVL